MSHPCSSSPEHANCGIKIVWLRTLVLLGYTFTDVLELALSKEASSTGFGIKYSQVVVMDQFSTFIVFCAVILKWKSDPISSCSIYLPIDLSNNFAFNLFFLSHFSALRHHCIEIFRLVLVLKCPLLCFIESHAHLSSCGYDFLGHLLKKEIQTLCADLPAVFGLHYHSTLLTASLL